MKQRKNDKGEIVPDTCKCGGHIRLYIQGEPVFLCDKCKKYYGTLPFNNKKNIKENKNMKKKTIKLTESQLHNVIKESIKTVLKESTYQVIGPSLDGVDKEEAIDYLHGYDFSEDEPQTESILHADYIDSANGIDLYYDYAGDYYFFAIEDKDRKYFANRLQKGEYWCK